MCAGVATLTFHQRHRGVDKETSDFFHRLLNSSSSLTNEASHQTQCGPSSTCFFKFRSHGHVCRRLSTNQRLQWLRSCVPKDKIHAFWYIEKQQQQPNLPCILSFCKNMSDNRHNCWKYKSANVSRCGQCLRILSIAQINLNKKKKYLTGKIREKTTRRGLQDRLEKLVERRFYNWRWKVGHLPHKTFEEKKILSFLLKSKRIWKNS